MFWPLVEAQTSWFITFLILFWFLLSLFFYLCSGWMNEAVRNSLAESGLSRLCFGAARRVGLQTSFIFLLHHTTSVCLTEDDTNTFFHQWLARDNLNFKLMWHLFGFQVFKEWRTDVFEAWNTRERLKLDEKKTESVLPDCVPVEGSVLNSTPLFWEQKKGENSVLELHLCHLSVNVENQQHLHLQQLL